MTIIEGELAEPGPPVWVCPRCTRRIDDPERAARAIYCAGDPTTGRSHPIARMTDLSQPIRRMISP